MTATVAALLPIADPPAAVCREEPRISALIDAARAGDRDAFGELVALNQRGVFRTALAALGSREDAEDAAQEAFVMAWRKLAAFRGDSTFRTWLLTITWRKALDRRRVRSLWWRRTEQPHADDGKDALEDLAAANATPEATVVTRDLAVRIRACIRRLSPKLKDTFLLAMTGEHTYEEIGTMLRVPTGTVKWRVAEARKLIQERLGARAAGPHAQGNEDDRPRS